MADPISALAELERLRVALGQAADTLAEAESDLSGVTLEYEEFMGSYEEGLWTAHVNDGAKFPPEALRTRMGHRAMPPELLGRYTGLVSQRKRAQERVRALKAEISAQQSILSALREEAQATR